MSSRDRYTTRESSHVPPPEGTHKAVLVQFVELGMQPGYNGGADEDTVYLTFELPNARKDNGEPFLVGGFYTIKSGPKAKWTRVQKALLGRTPMPGDVIIPDDMIGRGCQISIVHQKRADDGSVIGKIESLVALPHGEEAPKTDNNLVLFEFENPAKVVLDTLPDFLQNKIAQGKPYPAAPPPPPPVARPEFDDDIPL